MFAPRKVFVVNDAPRWRSGGLRGFPLSRVPGKVGQVGITSAWWTGSAMPLPPRYVRSVPQSQRESVGGWMVGFGDSGPRHRTGDRHVYFPFGRWRRLTLVLASVWPEWPGQKTIARTSPLWAEPYVLCHHGPSQYEFTSSYFIRKMLRRWVDEKSNRQNELIWKRSQKCMQPECKALLMG